ncbi:HNH endonuclease signature motif containing protein [Aeromicrobium sp.]|uniref:HNH endonuclease signature motif containing protein n=1 Tax=Aeromicrobium sp. TaxID=1871063 RepID=UPI002FC6A669
MALAAIPLDSYAGLAPDEIVAECEALGRLESQVKAHQLAAARALETSKAAASLGATSTGALLANTFGGDPSAAKRMLGQAARLQDASQTQAALGRGEVTLAQAELIARTVKDLPGDPSPEQREACETQLLDDAPQLTFKDLTRRADRITEVFAPEKVDSHENDILVKREDRALKESYFWIADRRDGTYKGEFVIPEAQGDMLKNCLEALNAPQIKQREDNPALAVLDDKPTYGQQMAVAFMTLIEHLPADKLPVTAGVGVTLTVNIELKSLIDGLKAGTLSTGCRVSASQVRRMACEQAILPMVFNGKPLPLDCGREQRLFNRAQRRAAERRDGGCSFPGCDRPPSWCVGHHARKRWGQGGPSNLEDIVLICPHHHRIVHAQEWEIWFADDGIPEYIPPPSIDPQRRPLRNNRYRPQAA